MQTINSQGGAALFHGDRSPDNKYEGPRYEKAGLDIVIAGYAGQAGSIRLYGEHENEIRGRFSPSFTESFLKDADVYMTRVQEAVKKVDQDLISGTYTAGEGGVYAALWDFAKEEDCGINVYLKKIPIRQDIIEICDLYGEDPYIIYSAGCILFASPRGNILAEQLRRRGCPAEAAGYFTDGNDRIIKNDDNIRFLTPFRG